MVQQTLLRLAIEHEKEVLKSSNNKIMVVTHKKVLEGLTCDMLRPNLEDRTKYNLIDGMIFRHCEMYPYYYELHHKFPKIVYAEYSKNNRRIGNDADEQEEFE